jgi:hypothetical protein
MSKSFNQKKTTKLHADFFSILFISLWGVSKKNGQKIETPEQIFSLRPVLAADLLADLPTS